MFTKEKATAINELNINKNILETWKKQGEFLNGKIKQRNKAIIKRRNLKYSITS